MVVASFVISIVALLVAGLAAYFTGVQAAAARRSVSAGERSAEVAEGLAARYSPPWVLTREEGPMFLLTNESEEATHDVTVEGAELVQHGPTAFERIGPRSSVRLILTRPFDAVDETVLVTWARGPGGKRLDWSRPLPLAPR